jgi:prenyltransferase beta subunit
MSATYEHKRQFGMALITSLILLSVLTTVALSIINSINMEEKIATTYRKSLDVKNIADSGISEALRILDSSGGNGISNGFNDELTGTNFPINDTTFGYKVTLVDNTDASADLFDDQDNKVFLISEATKGNSKAKIQVLVQTDLTNLNILSWKEVAI